MVKQISEKKQEQTMKLQERMNNAEKARTKPLRTKISLVQQTGMQNPPPRILRTEKNHPIQTQAEGVYKYAKKQK